MKFFIFFIFASSGAWAHSAFHLDLEMSGQELARVLDAQKIANKSLGASEKLRNILDAGKRNLDWLNEINRHRQVPISLYSKQDLGGIPIDSPKTYSDRSILQNFLELKQSLPLEISTVIFSSRDFPPTAPFEDEVYRDWTKKIDRSYQMAARWVLLEPYLPMMERYKRYDVRGYYFLSRTENLKSELDRYSKLNLARQNQLKEWISQLCFLNLRETERTCRNGFEKNIHELYTYVQNYFPKGLEVYNSFFEIPGDVSKRNMKWESPSRIYLNFESNPLAPLNDFLKINLEEEWQWNGLKMNVVFDQDFSNLVQVAWVPGVTPHVDGLGGLSVTMDANSSLADWDTQWTIRHEIGHVIGFPDCYLEFYDSEKQEIVSYQIDVEDLMCSRKGKMNSRIANEIIRHYGSF